MHDVPEGFVYRTWHMRETDDCPCCGAPSLEYAPKGGRTKVVVGYMIDHRTEHGTEHEFVAVASGEARCSELDTYNKKRGRDIALGRALKALEDAQESTTRQVRVAPLAYSAEDYGGGARREGH